MSEWHVTPDYILDHWTDELFNLMVGKLSERKEREVDAIKGRSSSAPKVSDKFLFKQASNMIEVKRGN